MKASSLFMIASLFLFAAGCIITIVNISNFSDQNIALMVGIGFVVASVFIFTISAFFPLLDNNRDRK